MGTVLKWNDSHSRWRVKLDGFDTDQLLKPGNLLVVKTQEDFVEEQIKKVEENKKSTHSQNYADAYDAIG